MASLTSVVYHNIGAETGFEAGLNVTIPWQTFAGQIAFLARNYDVVDLNTILSGRLPKRPLLITFDDCYASSFAAAREVLKPLGLPSVFFINPGLLGPDEISLESVLARCASSACARKSAFRLTAASAISSARKCRSLVRHRDRA